MEPIFYINRQTGEKKEEKVYGETVLRFLYGNCFGKFLSHLISRIPFFSWLYGYLQTRPSSQKKIVPFIKKFKVDPSEFLLSPDTFSSFNDFFIRKLKPESRPLSKQPAIVPADGRYFFYQNIHEAQGFVVKGQKFDLATLLDNELLAYDYAHGTMVMARLCPTDYHRFHFPCDCVPGETKLINGWLYSVNPMAVKRDVTIFTQNKRTLCELHTEGFGKVLFLEIGATFVGSIHQTYTPGKAYKKGDEKGYFSFGASSLILLFPHDKLQLDQDLISLSSQQIEVKCLMGQSLGTLK